MIAIDTNLLVYAHRTRTPQHTSPQRAISRAAANPRGWGLAAAVLPEFWSVVTHPDAAGRPSSPAQAAAFLRALSDAGAIVWQPGPGFGERLVRVARDLSISGARVFDLQIAMTAFEGGATEMWTHDAAFVTIAGLPIHDPLRA